MSSFHKKRNKETAMNKLHWKDAMYLISLFMGVAVVWGMTTTRINYIEKRVEEKADKELIETKLDYIIERVDNIEEMLGKDDI